jgi:hypothetical protein
MKNRATLFFVTFSFFLNGFHIDNIDYKKYQSPHNSSTLDVTQFFSFTQPHINKFVIVTGPQALKHAAQDSLRYLETHTTTRKSLTDPEGFRSLMSLEDVKKTLKFIVQVIEEDLVHGKHRIHSTTFLKHHFKFLKWTADWKTAQSYAIQMPHDGQIRLTMYGILTVKGNNKKTSAYPCGLYKLNDHSIQKNYTKQQILGGVLEQPHNKPKRTTLAWVSRQDSEDALMHGTVLVQFPDGSHKMLNVDQSNGIPYNRKQKNVLGQKRYWFFRELDNHAKPLDQMIEKFKERKNVIFAGDLQNIGIGKLIAITYINPTNNRHEIRLGILADTGSAFHENLYQLDLYAGLFKSRHALKDAIGRFPSATDAFVLCKK